MSEQKTDREILNEMREMAKNLTPRWRHIEYVTNPGDPPMSDEFPCYEQGEVDAILALIPDNEEELYDKLGKLGFAAELAYLERNRDRCGTPQRFERLSDEAWAAAAKAIAAELRRLGWKESEPARPPREAFLGG